MCAEEEKRGKEKEEKRKGKRRIKIGVVYVHEHVFSYAQWSFFEYIKKTVSRLSRSYSLLFAIKILMVRQFGAFLGPNMHPTLILSTFFKYLWPS